MTQPTTTPKMVEMLAREIDAWDGCYPQDGKPTQRARDAARKFIAAMRVPSAAMIASVDDYDDDHYVARGRAIESWQSFIDAALQDDAA